MKYAKVQQALPKYRYVRELDPELDTLLYDVFDNDQLIVDRNSTLDDKLIEDLQRREIRKVWVRTITYSWMPYEDALAENLNIVETKEAHPVKDHLLKNFGDIKGIQSLEKIIEAYEDQSLDEMTYSQLVSVRSYLPDLKDQEQSITEDLHAIEDDDLRFRIMDVLRSRNPRLDPEDYPEEVQSLIKDISDFLTELRDVKDQISQLIMDIGPEKTPELAEGTLETKDFTPPGQEAITDAVEFAEELYALEPDDYPEFLTDGFYRDVHQLIMDVLLGGRWDEDNLLDVTDSLSKLRSELPNLIWVLPLENAVDDNLLAQALGRLLIHAHTWPNDVFGDDAPLFYAALLLCDVGMIEVPETFWNNDETLSEDQRAEIEEHPRLGAEMLEAVSGLPDGVLEAIRLHHHRGDGRGYPKTLEDWSSLSQKLTLVDIFDSLTSPRYRREAYAPKDAFEMLNEAVEFDEPGLLEDLRDAVGQYPPGSMIRLDDDSVALVESAGNEPDKPQFRPLVMEGETITELGSVTSLEETDVSLKSSSRQRVAPWSVRRVRWRLDETIALEP